MKVLFISRAKTNDSISTIVKNQGESLKSLMKVTYFAIKGRGFNGYLKAIIELREHLKKNDYDIIHAHYSLSAYTASLAGARPLVVSLMGSDVSSKSFYKFFIKFFNYFFWKKLIVKSDEMKSILEIKDVFVIPNGVDFDKFKPIDKSTALIKTRWDISKKHILFAANPNRPEKNYKIAKEAFDLLDNRDLELHFLENVSNNDMPYYFNAADVVLLTSLREGSPNVIKEAMACNVPIVSTNVGDVKKVIGKTKGCYIAHMTPQEIALKIRQAILFDMKTNGRKNIKYLNEVVVAENINDLYKMILDGIN